MTDWVVVMVYGALLIWLVWFHWMDRRDHQTERHREKVLDELQRIREELSYVARRR